MATNSDSCSVDDVIARLKKLKAVKLRVACADGEPRTVRLTQSRKRWQDLMRVLGGLEWVSIEAQNARGEVLEVFESDHEYEDDDEAPVNAPADIDARVVRLATNFMKLSHAHTEKALERQTQHMSELLSSTAKMHRVMADRLVAVERMYEAKLQMLDVLMSGERGGGDEDPLLSGKMLEAVLPAVAKKMMGGES